MCYPVEYGSTPVTIDQALLDANLAFNAVKKPVYDEAGNEVPGMYRVMRTDITAPALGINKGSRYQVIQHYENLRATIEGLYDSPDQAIINRVLNLYNGRLAVCQIDLDTSEIVSGDTVMSRFSIFSDHGIGGYGAKLCMTREVCINTYNRATREAEAIGKYVCNRHTGDVIGKARQTADILGLARKEQVLFVEAGQHLAATPANAGWDADAC